MNKFSVKKKIHPEDNVCIRIAGTGGQGIGMLALLLSKACLLEWKNILQTHRYSPEVRGKPTRADIILSKDVIDFPRLTKIDIFVALDQSACLNCSSMLNQSTQVIYDSDLVTIEPSDNVFFLTGIPFARIVETRLGSSKTANMAALGTTVAVTNIVNYDSVLSVLKQSGNMLKQRNLDAFITGFELGMTGPLQKTVISPAHLKTKKTPAKNIQKNACKFHIKIDERLCKRCGICVYVCQKDVFSLSKTSLTVNPDNCSGCKRCEILCPDFVIEIEVQE
jgi:2-oxoglutarate ferredoxin oxidoreductase subunit gamma